MSRERIGEVLLRTGVLSQTQLTTALREHARTGVRLGQILVDHGFVEEATLYDGIAKITGLERFDLRTAILEGSALDLVTADWALEHGMVPVKVDLLRRTMHVAVTDPTNLMPLDDLAFRLGLKTKALVASETELQRIVHHHFYRAPLDRDPRHINRPGGRRPTGDIEPAPIQHGMDFFRDEVLKQSTEAFGTSAEPTDTHEHERAALEQLRPVYEGQEEAARALRTVFELCVARGVITREEYFERLQRAPD